MNPFRLLPGSMTLYLLILPLLLTISLVEGLAKPPKPQYSGGAGVGRLVITEKTTKTCHYDMVLVERIQGRPPTDSGLFIPQQDLPRLHLCRVIAMGPGREEENGRIAPMPDIQIGDIVVAKNPWGIGPKDEETTDGKKLSFMRAQDVAAKVSGGLVDPDHVVQKTN
jgi:chaperonin GroES